MEKIYAYLDETAKQTLYKESLNYEDIIKKTTYELIKIDNIPEDYKYGFEDLTSAIILSIVLILCCTYLDSLICGETIIERYSYYSSDLDSYTRDIESSNERIKKLLANKEEFVRKMSYLLDTNKELKDKYDKMMRDPAIKEIISKIEGIDLSLMKEDEKVSKGKMMVLEKN